MWEGSSALVQFSSVAQLCLTLCDPRDYISSVQFSHSVVSDFWGPHELQHARAPKLPKPLTVWITINCGKFWKRWEYQTCLLRNLYAGQEAIVRTGHGITDWFQIGKGVHQGCILSPCLFNLYAKYIMRNAGLNEEHKLESRLLGEISITSDMQMTPYFWQIAKKN